MEKRSLEELLQSLAEMDQVAIRQEGSQKVGMESENSEEF